MHTAEFISTVTLLCSVEAVFDFLTRPENGPRYAPPENKLRILEAPDRLQLGSRVKFHMRGFGQPLRVENEVVEYDEPHCFAEIQASGPMKYFRHVRMLESIGESETRLTDQVLFTPPGGLVGFVMTEARIRAQLERGFTHQHSTLRDILEATS